MTVSKTVRCGFESCCPRCLKNDAVRMNIVIVKLVYTSNLHLDIYGFKSHSRCSLFDRIKKLKYNGTTELGYLFLQKINNPYSLILTIDISMYTIEILDNRCTM